MKDLETLNNLFNKAQTTPLGKKLLRRNIKNIPCYMQWKEIVNFFDDQRKTFYYLKALSNLEEIPSDADIPQKYLNSVKATPCFYVDQGDVPIIYADKELVSGMLKTDIPKSISQSIKKVYPNLILMLPEGSLVVEGFDVGCLYLRYSEFSNGYIHLPFVQPPQYEKNTLYSEFPINEIKVNNKDTVLNTLAFARDSNYVITGSVCLDPSKDDYLITQHHEYAKAIAEALRAIAIQTYLILEHKPEMATESPYQPQTRQEARQCRINPVEPTRWLGKGFSLPK